MYAGQMLYLYIHLFISPQVILLCMLYTYTILSMHNWSKVWLTLLQETSLSITLLRDLLLQSPPIPLDKK